MKEKFLPPLLLKKKRKATQRKIAVLDKKKIEIVHVATRCKDQNTCYTNMVISNPSELNTLFSNVWKDKIRLRKTPIDQHHHEIQISIEGKARVHEKAFQLIHTLHHITRLIDQHNENIDARINQLNPLV